MASALGCDHYIRKCKFVTPCCQKLYTCRFCHDDKENHPLNRNTVKQLICAVCNKIQAVRKKCQGCGTQFGQYACLECNLFDDDYKGQFHCSDCGLCRVGGWENFFHCEKCNLCLNVMLLNNHKPATKMAAAYVGCSHYRRKCSLVCPCCEKIYICRFCHDEKENHSLDRTKVKQIVCEKCDHMQPTGPACLKCNSKFGTYVCLLCNLFDDDDSKQQFHCLGCKICRVGGRENYFHCTTCNMCLNVRLKDSHKCVENMSHQNCPICLEQLHTSIRKLYLPKCGHLLHQSCHDDLVKSNRLTCPTCLQLFEDSIQNSLSQLFL